VVSIPKEKIDAAIPRVIGENMSPKMDLSLDEAFEIR
jgi:hypothetical protein